MKTQNLKIHTNSQERYSLSFQTKYLWRIILLTICIPMSSIVVKAETFCVSNSTELQTALTTAASNSQSDTIKLVQGTYFGNFIFSSTESQNLVIQGGYYAGCTSRNLDPNNTILDGEKKGTVLALVSAEYVNLNVEGITVQEGERESAGAGMYILTSGRVNLNQNIIKDNFVSSYGDGIGVSIEGSSIVFTANILENNIGYGTGGGAYIKNQIVPSGSIAKPIIISNNTFKNNIITGHGGGLMVKSVNSQIILINNHFEGNEGQDATFPATGGGANISVKDVISDTSAIIRHNSFIRNKCREAGGGISVNAGYGKKIIIDNNDFFENSNSSYASYRGYGGGLSISGAEVDISIINNSYIGNSCTATDNGGGAIMLSGNGNNYKIVNNLFSENIAGIGGAISLFQQFNPGDPPSNLALTNNTFYGNQATLKGGAILLHFGEDGNQALIYNNIIYDNDAPEGADLYMNNDGNNNFIAAPIILKYNNFDHSTSGIYAQLPVPIDTTNFNRIDPIFVDTLSGDFRLEPNSPLVDAGENDAPEILSTDLDGKQRIINDTVDLGAYETVDPNEPPLASNQVACLGLPVPDLIAFGTNLKWYSDSELTNLVYSGNPFSTGVTDAGTYTYYVTQTYDGLESQAREVTLVISDQPIVVANASMTEICEGKEITIFGSGAQTYAWDNGVIDGVSFMPSAGLNTYTVTGFITNSCSSTDTITITVNDLPSIDAGEDLQICYKDEVTLHGSGGQTYIWNKGVVDGVAFIPTDMTTYAVIGTDLKNCSNTDSLTIQIKNPVDTSVTIEGNSISANANIATYQWIDCATDEIIPGETSGTFVPSVTGMYAVEVTENECVDTSSCYRIVIVGINENALNSKIVVYPNPLTSSATIEFPNPSNNRYQLTLRSLSGDLIKQIDGITDSKYELHCDGMLPGLYFIELKGSKTYRRKIIIE